MMIVQICQPVFGSISDKTRSRFGRRRPYIILGQVISTIALVIMRSATGFWVYCWGYQLYQVGNCVVFATWCAIQPGLHDRQRGIYGGYIKLCMGIGFLLAALLGFADGKQYLSHDQTWAILIGLQVPLMLIGIASFSESPGFLKPELDAPNEVEEEESLSLPTGEPMLGMCSKMKVLALDVVAPFQQPMYRSLFVYCEFHAGHNNWLALTSPRCSIRSRLACR
jgi:Na+/melibiose symporter-like transporter